MGRATWGQAGADGGGAAAKDFSIGFYRGQVYIPIRHCDGSINGFVGYADGQMKLPPKWLPLLPTW